MAFVQAVSAATSAFINILITPAITTTTGNFLTIGTSVLNNGNSPVPSDAYNNVWTGHTSNPLVIPGQNDKGYSWWAKNITGGTSHTFTVSSTQTANSSIIVAEHSGRALDFPVAAQGGAVDSVATANHVTGSVTTPMSGCDLWAFNFTASTVSENYNTGLIWGIPNNASNGSVNLYQPSFGQLSNNISQNTWNNTWASSDSVQGGGFIYAIKPPSYTIIQTLQNSTGTGQTGVSVPAASTVAVTTGNTLIYVAKYSSSSVQSVVITDTLNNAWQQINSYFDGSNNTGFTFGFAKNIVGGQTQFGMSMNGATANFLGLWVAEVSGLSANPFTTGEFVITKVVSPGNGANGVASQFTGNISRRPALLLGFCMDATNTGGQVLSPGTNFNALPGVWTFGLSQTAALPEHQRI
jgi:hypothetical protein